MRGALSLGLLLLEAGLMACAPAIPPGPVLSHAPPAAIAAPDASGPALATLALAAQAAQSGADPLEGESAQRDTERAGGASGRRAIQATAPEVPTWLRAVREPPPVTFIGSGRAGPKRVGLQVGHWGNELLPAELEHLRESGGGAVGGGYTEVQINYDLAQRTAALLRARDVEVDVLPATVPVDYQADAFLAIHADGDARDAVRGFKLARSPLSKIPAWDDALVGWLYAEYARVTGLPRDDEHVTRNMEYYYAFNNRRYYYAIAPSTPAAILEAGFLTSAADRTVLVTDPDRAAGGIAAGLLGFLDLQR